MSDDLIVLASPPPSPLLRVDWNEHSLNEISFDILDLPSAIDLHPSPTKRPRAYSSRVQEGGKKRMRSNKPNILHSLYSSSGNSIGNDDTLQIPHDLNSDEDLAYDPRFCASSPTPEALIPDWSQDGPEMFEPLLAPSISNASDSDQYSDFVEAALTACLGFFRLTTSVYVVQGWDSKTGTATELPDDEDLLQELGPVQLIFRDLSEGRHLFSVETPFKHGLKLRAIVQHEGNADGGGIWRCSKDGGHGCPHIQRARDYLQQLLCMDPAARDESELTQANFGVRLVGRASGVSNGTSSVSFKPILPPVWAELDTDLPLPYPRPSPITSPPPLIRLEEDSQCMCGASRQNNCNPVVTNTCRVYGILGCYDTNIELQRCTQCTGGRQHFIGPDSRELGLFNYNNRVLFSHDLLDDYTMAYTSSETPFTTWVGVSARRYKVHRSRYPFVSETVFRAAWFGYAQHLSLDGDFQCSRCGSVPQEPIFDGVVVVFNKSRILDSLRPPTTLHSDSVMRSSRLVKGKALIVEAKLQKNFWEVIQSSALIIKGVDVDDDRSGMGSDESDDEGEVALLETQDSEPTTRAQKRTNEHIRRSLSILPSVHSELAKIDESLGHLFERLFCNNRTAIALPYKRLLIQISSRESILQIANQRALEALSTFNESPTVENMTRLLEIPCIYNVLMHEHHTTGYFSADTLGICRWMHPRGQSLLCKLKEKTAGVPPMTTSAADQDWEWIKVRI
ncbi:hypothetical protein H0H92_001569 [Tricholoma furcatifolium]|nr:hypothetical protein H0H92_001569 [Tricholoma furcatifolium]